MTGTIIIIVINGITITLFYLFIGVYINIYYIHIM